MSEHSATAGSPTPPLPDRMASLAADHATGVLVTGSEGSRREIVFVNGEIRAARSDAEEEKLGLWLVAHEVISEDDRALTLLAQGSETGLPLGHLLVNRGSLDAEKLQRELQELTLTIIRRAAAQWPSEHEFQSGRSSEQPDTLPDLFTSQIILIAARAFQDATAKRAAVGSLDQTVWPSSGIEHLLQDYKLTPTEGFLLSRVDGARTIASLLQVAALPQEQAISTLYSLIISGVVKVGDRKTTPRPEETAAPPLVRAAEQVDESMLTDQQQQERRDIRRLADDVTKVDHYRALGLRPGATADDIAKAWERLQQRYDPRRSSEPHLRDLGSRMQAVVERAREAYEVLSSARDRRRYDRVLRDVESDRDRLTKRDRGKDSDAIAARNAIVEANLKRADELIHDGELYLAIQLLEQACALDPRPTELVKLSRLLLRNPLWTNRALSCMRRAIQIDPQFVEAWIELALFWRRRRNPERERKALEKAIAADPDNTRGVQMYKELVGKRELERLLRRAQHGRS